MICVKNTNCIIKNLNEIESLHHRKNLNEIGLRGRIQVTVGFWKNAGFGFICRDHESVLLHKDILKSENQLECKLNKSRLVRLGRHDAELRRTQHIARIAELRAVEKVEELRAKLKVQLFIRPKPGVLENRKIQIVDPVSAHIRQGAADISKRESRRLAEFRDVEPTIQPLRSRAVQAGALAVIVGPRAAAEGTGEIGCRRECDRHPALGCEYPIDCPTGD
jgi:hypothetical protein